MSAVVCVKRSLFEEIHPPVPKRLRCRGSSPTHLHPSRSGCLVGSNEVESVTSSDPANQVSQLRSLFPDMDGEVIQKVLESNGNNLDSAIRSLNELRLSSDRGADINHGYTENNESNLMIGQKGIGPQPDAVEIVSADKENSGKFEGSQWVELFVREMLSASNLDDAKDRATRALEAFETTLVSRSGCVFQELQKENTVLKQQIQTLIRENHVLKRAVTIQHERQLEHENCAQEVQTLKQLVVQYQDQVRTLELNNYSLSLHLRRAQEGSSMPGRFHPDVF
ncbi:hypothetical protein KP509_24G030600 [Ceratopteris richardii]|uniref:CUE domain-containing protein n=1 Tax=Ceratopteris richardii TaxID=49495 RepID=A0A8T2RVN9_CERRI|nr:hypothetical protein KP509_24G030600 [Ceratopteris richardii]